MHEDGWSYTVPTDSDLSLGWGVSYHVCTALCFTGPGVILFSPDSASSSDGTGDSVDGNSSSNSSEKYSIASVHRLLLATVVLTAILSSVLTIAAQIVLSRCKQHHHHQDKARYEYTPL